MDRYFCDFSSYFARVEEAAAWIFDQTGASPAVALSLTGGVVLPPDLAGSWKIVEATAIPHYPSSRVEGHAGKLLFGTLEGREAVILQGRSHYYEGFLPQAVVFPCFVLHKLGVKTWIATNAAGGVNPQFKTGDFMVIRDQINAMGEDPLRGLAVLRPARQFVDLTAAYPEPLRRTATEAAAQLGLTLREGVYLGTPGPCYETPAEIRMFRSFGADAVGMSTVFETAACNYLGIEVLGISCITNPAADLHPGTMSHEEVLDAMNRSGPRMMDLVLACLRKIADS